MKPSALGDFLRFKNGSVRHHCTAGGGMAYLYRLIHALCLFLVLASASQVNAFPATSTNSTCDATGCYTYSVQGYFPRSTPSAVCTAWAAQPSYAATGTMINSNTCYAINNNGQQISQATISPTLVTGIYSCPSGSTLSGSSCSCTAPNVENASHTGCESAALNCTLPQVANAAGTACETPVPQCPAGSTNVSGTCVCAAPNIMNGSAVPGSDSSCVTRAAMCDSLSITASLYGGENAASEENEIQIAHSTSSNGPQSDSFVCKASYGFPAGEGCTAKWETSIRHQKTDGTWLSYGHAIRVTGNSLPCNGNNDPNEIKNVPTGLPVTCKGGQSGEVNGKTVCIPFLSSTKTEQPSSGKTEEPDNNGNPVTTEKEVNTVCQNGKCTTTTKTNITSTVTVNGVSQTNTTTSTSTVDQPKSDYCTKNPKVPTCGQSGDGGSSFGGSCDADFVCDGDGLMCAMAKEQYKRNCELFVNKSDESDLYETAKGLDQTKPVMEPTDVTISSASFNTSNALGGGSGGMTDKTITVAGKSVTLQFSRVNQYLEMLGSVLMMISFLMAIRIVSRG